MRLFVVRTHVVERINGFYLGATTLHKYRPAPLAKLQVFLVHFFSATANVSILLYYWLLFCFNPVTYR